MLDLVRKDVEKLDLLQASGLNAYFRIGLKMAKSKGPSSTRNVPPHFKKKNRRRLCLLMPNTRGRCVCKRKAVLSDQIESFLRFGFQPYAPVEQTHWQTNAMPPRLISIADIVCPLPNLVQLSAQQTFTSAHCARAARDGESSLCGARSKAVEPKLRKPVLIKTCLSSMMLRSPKYLFR